MHDDEWFEVLSAAADDQLAPAERAQVDAHLDRCERCASAVAVLQAHRRRACLHTDAAPSALVEEVVELGLPDAAAAQRASGALARRLAGALAGVTVASLGLVALTGAPAARSSAPEVVLVAAHDGTFDRSDIRVAVGSTVQWRNEGEQTHQLVTDLGSATVQGSLEPGATEAATFTSEGRYEFRCTVHEGMTGTVTVAA